MTLVELFYPINFFDEVILLLWMVISQIML